MITHEVSGKIINETNTYETLDAITSSFSKKTGEQIAGIEVHRPMNVADEIDALVDSYEEALRYS